MAVEQIPLPLSAQQSNSADYFVSHSGVADALRSFEGAVHRLNSDPSFFQSFYIYGSSGVGKSHLLSVMKGIFAATGIASEHLQLRDFGDALEVPDSAIGEIVSAYEGIRTAGGILVFAARIHPEKFTQNPHLLSRLRSGAILELKPPTIEELRPTLESLLERKNLKLSERNLEYLIRRVPTNPLSLWGILARMDDRALREGRTMSLHFIREILGEI